jgi:hypothetical protein
MHHNNMPIGQHNANPGEGLQVRIGIPHRGGKLAFHAFNHGYPAMVSVSAFWNPAKGSFVIPEASDLYELDFALDSAGFTAVRGWQSKGDQPGMAKVYPWSYHQYIEVASLLRPTWWSAPDLCCEPELSAGDPEVIRHRLNVTGTLLEGTLRIVYEWQNELAKSCNSTVVADLIKPPVPILQGWTKDQYLYSLDLTMQVWERWQPWLAPPKLIGLGSVCRRTTSHPEHGLYAILQSLDGKIPQGSQLHLFGVKGAALSEVKKLPWVASIDSMAFDLGARITARKEQRSNTLEHRANEMTRWMASAARRVITKVGDQQDLCLVP